MTGFPLRYATGNLLLGHGDERCALYRIGCISYPFLPDREKHVWLARLAQFAFSVEADFSLWRVSRAYEAGAYAARAAHLLDERHARRATWDNYLAGHCQHLAGLQSHIPELYLAVSLQADEPAQLGAGLIRAADRARRRIEQLAGTAAAQPISGNEIAALVAAEERAFARLSGVLPARRATTTELQWLLRRAACRGVCEPVLDEHWQPNALVVRSDTDQVAYEPLQTSLLRLANAPIVEEERSLIVDADEARSYQAMLALGALPEETQFPGARAELLFAPLEQVEFPVDAVLHARWLGNREATSRVRRRVVDADNIYSEQAESRHGATWAADENRTLARELESYLQSEAHPPMLQAAISYAIGAPTRELLESRVESLSAALAPVSLHRPLALQPQLFMDHLPRAGGGDVTDYSDFLTIEQFGALMPIATHHTGAQNGVYIGTTTGGGRRPVTFDITAASRESRPPSILIAGTLGSGKTITAELLALQAALRGSIVVDVDPKPDHRLEHVPELEGQVHIIELSGDERYRGMLDPMRVTHPSIREETASSYYMELLPQAPPSWETQIRRAVREAVRQERPSSLAVIELLQASDNKGARDAAESLEVWAESGLGRLAFGELGSDEQLDVVKPVTTSKASGLSLPAPTATRADYTQTERIGLATLRLVAAYAMRLVSGDRSRSKVVLFDEAWFLLASPEGRRLIDRLNRLGRSENATLILATQQLGDVGEIENLIGTRLIFGHETQGEAQRALQLLGLDPDDPALVQRVRGYRAGRGLMRDLNDQIAEVQIDVAYPHILDALNTTPHAHQPVNA